MEETKRVQQSTDSGEKSGSQGVKLRLPDLPDFKLGQEGDLDAFHATDEEFLSFIETLVPLEGENLDHWTWEERRDFLNWCLDEQVLCIKDGRLVPQEVSEDAQAMEEYRYPTEVGDSTRNFTQAAGVRGK